MREYVIMTDSSCDLPYQMANALEVDAAPLTVILNGETFRNYLDEREIQTETFYRMLREGKEGTTAAVNVDGFIQTMEPYLQQGKDILALAFSSGLSATYQAATIAAEDLRAKYPDREILIVDTLCASMGQGLIVYLAVQEKRKGKSMEVVRDYVESIKLKLAHWFTVDDLNHLKRGGRISTAAALLGSTLNIKPILHVDDEGHLVPSSKVRGRKHAIKKLADCFAQSAISPEEQTVFISHGACLEDAELLANEIRQRATVKEIVIGYVGPVIGAHSGPGTLALFYLADQR